MFGGNSAYGEYDPALEAALVRLNGGPIVEGTPGGDVVRGGKGDDHIDVSQGGDDIVDARKGNDTIYFGGALTPADRVDVSKVGKPNGIDELVLEGDYSQGLNLDGSFLQGIEILRLLAGGSYSIGGDFNFNNDFVGRYSTVFIYADALGENDRLRFDGSRSVVTLVVFGGAGDDVLVGGEKNVSFVGWAGDDNMSTGDGGGGLYGGEGADLLNSGAGATSFGYQLESESSKKSPDLIQNFKAGDETGLYFVDADTTQPGLQHLHFGETSEHVGDVTVRYNRSLDLTIVKAFTDGDAKADMVIHLKGQIDLTAPDFMLADFML